MSTASTATLEPKTELEGSGARKASALRVLRMLQTAIGPTIAGLLRVLTTGSGASRDFGPAKTSWRIEDPQAAKQKCLISSRFPSLTRVPLSASAAERRLLSADAPEPRNADRSKNAQASYVAGGLLSNPSECQRRRDLRWIKS